MIITGLEEEEDMKEFEEFVRRLPEIMRTATHRPRVIFSATPLVRFPWTPLEFAPAYPAREPTPRSARRIGHIARQAGFEYRGAADEAENYVSQVLVRADRPAFWAALKAAAAAYRLPVLPRDGHGIHERAARQAGGSGHRRRTVLGRFRSGGQPKAKPWSRWETGVRREFLHVQYKRARRFVDPGYCLGTMEEEAACLACTACETPEEMDFLTDLRRKHEADAEGFDGRRKLIRQSAETMALGVRLDGQGASACRANIRPWCWPAA